MADNPLRALGETLQGEVQTLLHALGTGWLEHQENTDQDCMALDALAAELGRIFQLADEWLALDTWLTSGFMPVDLLSTSEAQSTEPTGQAAQASRRATIQPDVAHATPGLSHAPRRDQAGREMTQQPREQHQPWRPQAGETFWPVEAGRASSPMVPPAASPWPEPGALQSAPAHHATPEALGKTYQPVQSSPLSVPSLPHQPPQAMQGSPTERAPHLQGPPSAMPAATRVSSAPSFPNLLSTTSAAPVLGDMPATGDEARQASGSLDDASSTHRPGVIRPQDMAESQPGEALGQPTATGLGSHAHEMVAVPHLAPRPASGPVQGLRALAARLTTPSTAAPLPAVPATPLLVLLR